jgi:hypothetical protein
VLELPAAAGAGTAAKPPDLPATLSVGAEGAAVVVVGVEAGFAPKRLEVAAGAGLERCEADTPWRQSKSQLTGQRNSRTRWWDPHPWLERERTLPAWRQRALRQRRAQVQASRA